MNTGHLYEKCKLQALKNEMPATLTVDSGPFVVKSALAYVARNTGLPRHSSKVSLNDRQKVKPKQPS